MAIAMGWAKLTWRAHPKRAAVTTGLYFERPGARPEALEVNLKHKITDDYTEELAVVFDHNEVAMLAAACKDFLERRAA